MHSGVIFKAPVSLQFSEPGDVPIFIVILDTQRNRIAGDGRLIYVKPKNQSSVLPSAPTAEANPIQNVMLAPTPQWHVIESEDFSSTNWPSSAQWVVNDTTVETPTDLDRKWGVHPDNNAA
jgi:hypothetical protein